MLYGVSPAWAREGVECLWPTEESRVCRGRGEVVRGGVA